MVTAGQSFGRGMFARCGGSSFSGTAESQIAMAKKMMKNASKTTTSLIAQITRVLFHM
jgi:hypothetical protein